jgi:hypothetical protein
MLGLKAFPPRLRLLSSTALRKAQVQTQRPPATAESPKHDQDCTSVENRASPFTPRFLNHPYSLHEFDLAIPEYELQWRLHKAQLDSFNDDFWTDVSLLPHFCLSSAHFSFPRSPSRTTPASKKANPPPSPRYQTLHRLSGKSVLYPTSTLAGSHKSPRGTWLTTPNGANATERAS